MKKAIEEKLSAGINVILDWYSYSGIAYTAAKGIEVDWCIATEKGLPLPDVIVYLKFKDLDGLKNRDGYGEEIYEKIEFQQKVKNVYEESLVTEDWI